MYDDAATLAIQRSRRRGRETLSALNELVRITARSGNPDDEFFYLGGPMSNIPHFNFPRFFEVGDKLRTRGYNIISPAELDDPQTEKAALASKDGRDQKVAGQTWADFLARDLIVIALPTCVGGIFIEGWEDSEGAKLESYNLSRLGKQILTYHEGPRGGLRLEHIDRDEHLAAVGQRWNVPCIVTS